MKSINHRKETNESQADIEVNQINAEENEVTIVTNQKIPETRPNEYQIIRNEEGTKFQCYKSRS